MDFLVIDYRSVAGRGLSTLGIPLATESAPSDDQIRVDQHRSRHRHEPRHSFTAAASQLKNLRGSAF